MVFYKSSHRVNTARACSSYSLLSQSCLSYRTINSPFNQFYHQSQNLTSTASSSHSTMSSTTSHRAAILPELKAGKFQITTRPTPSPGPNELLIAPKALAVNPIDVYQRSMGIPPLEHYPAVIGSDIAGTIVSVGAGVTHLKAGDRVTAFANTFYEKGKPDYGAFQERALVPDCNAAILPASIGWKEGAILPMSVLTVWSGLHTIGLPSDTKVNTSTSTGNKQAFLVWGAASSIGSAAVQIAHSMGFVVFATASPTHHAWLRDLGATHLFDYHDANVVDAIVAQAKEDGVECNWGFDSVRGNIESCLTILSQTRGEGVTARLAEAATYPGSHVPSVEGVEWGFIQAPEGKEDRYRHARSGFGWLESKLERGEYVPSPPNVRVVEGGLEGLDGALDELFKGVSGTKLVVEL